jgi:hypothetical protein
MDQTVKPHEIILADNASSDGALGITRRFSSVQLMDHDRRPLTADRRTGRRGHGIAFVC